MCAQHGRDLRGESPPRELTTASEDKNRVGRIMQLNRIKAVRGYKSPNRIAGRPAVVAPNRV